MKLIQNLYINIYSPPAAVSAYSLFLFKKKKFKQQNLKTHELYKHFDFFVVFLIECIVGRLFTLCK